MSVIWVGTTVSQHTVNSPRFSFTASRNDLTLTYEGQYNNLLSERPTIGSGMSGFTGYTVERVDVQNLEGSKGQMTIGLFQDISQGSGGSPAYPIDAIYEIEWLQVEKKLELHPRYVVGGGGAKELTDDDLAELAQWENETNSTYRKAFSYLAIPGDDGSIETLSPFAQDFAAKKLKGVDSYLLFIPVLRKTSTGYVPPSVTTCGKIENPAPYGFPSIPGDYTFMRTADRGQKTGRSGKWERVQEWTGFDDIDTDIYESA